MDPNQGGAGSNNSSDFVSARPMLRAMGRLTQNLGTQVVQVRREDDVMDA
jgi:hypothetical protein